MPGYCLGTYRDNIYLPTGNMTISIPTLCSKNAGIECISYLSMKHRGSICLYGKDNDFIKPFFTIDGKELSLEGNLEWKRLNYWIPQFRYANKDMEIIGTLYAPIGRDAFCYQFKIKNLKKTKRNLLAGIKSLWYKTYILCYGLEQIRCGLKKVSDGPYNYRLSNSVELDFYTEAKLFSLIYSCSHTCDLISWNKDSLHNIKNISSSRKALEIEESSGESINILFGKNLVLEREEELRITFNFSIGLTSSSAGTTAIALGEKGDIILEDTMAWLNKRKLDVMDNDLLDEIMNVNLFFSYFYAHGETLDSKDLVLVTSRSPRYSVNTAFWARDSLLWCFPAMLEVDTDFSRRILESVFRIYIKNIGTRALLIDGTVCEYGFELDELCAPIVALGQYVEKTNDREILSNYYIMDGIRKIEKLLWDRKDKKEFLFSTDYLPDDQLSMYPYSTFDNVLVWRLFKNLAYFSYLQNKEPLAKRYEGYMKKTKQAIYNHCIIDGPYGRMFAWSVDLKGNVRHYAHEPTGSLKLLAFLGFVDEDNDIFQHTVDFMFDAESKPCFKNYTIKETGYEPKEGEFIGPWVWLLTNCHNLLTHKKEHGKQVILNAELDGGIACERVNKTTGVVCNGAAFATAAGFLAHAIYRAFGRRQH